jgi:hypothetical protein
MYINSSILKGNDVVHRIQIKIVIFYDRICIIKGFMPIKYDSKISDILSSYFNCYKHCVPQEYAAYNTNQKMHTSLTLMIIYCRQNFIVA